MARLIPTGRVRPWRAVVLACGAAYFLLPLAASVIFTVDVPGKGLIRPAEGGRSFAVMPI
jgi:putative spermidine/putrescine transport system permease protein